MMIRGHCFLTLDEVADTFHVSPRTIRRWWNAGKFPHPVYFDRRPVWSLTAVDTFVKTRTN